MTSSATRYRWVVLGTGTLGQGSAAAYFVGLAAITPALQAEYHIGLSGLGAMIGAPTLGLMTTQVAWGTAVDRFGDRRVMVTALGVGAVVLALVPFLPGLVPVLGALLVAGAAVAGANTASGRVVMQWFGPRERGLAMAVRTCALPGGAALAAVALPRIAADGGTRTAFWSLAGFIAFGALAALILLREPAAASAMPVSSAPVSSAPVSSAPVSSAPISAAPVSAAPVSVGPVSVAPWPVPPVPPGPVFAAPWPAVPGRAAPAAAGPWPVGPSAAVPAAVGPSTAAPAAGARPVAPVSARPERVRLRDAVRNWSLIRLCFVAGLLVVPQIAVTGFGIELLIARGGITPVMAAQTLVTVHLAGAGTRLLVGWSADQVGDRLRLLLWMAIAMVVAFTGLAVALSMVHTALPIQLTLIVVGALAIGWNGLAFVAAGEMAPPGRSATFLGVVNTAIHGMTGLSAVGIGALAAYVGWHATMGALVLPALVAATVLANFSTPKPPSPKDP